MRYRVTPRAQISDFLEENEWLESKEQYSGGINREVPSPQITDESSTSYFKIYDFPKSINLG